MGREECNGSGERWAGWTLVQCFCFRYDVLCVGGSNSVTFGIPEIEIYNPEMNSWSFKKPFLSGVFLHDLLPDPEGGLLLVGGLTSNLSWVIICFAKWFVD